MKPLTNRMILKKYMRRENLKWREVAEILGVSFWTVQSWILPENSKCHRSMPHRYLQHLKLYIKTNRMQNPEII